MLRNAISRNNFCLLKQFTDCHHTLPKAGFCSAAFIKANDKYVRRTITGYSSYYVGLTQMNVRQKMSVAKEVDATKKDHSTDLPPKEIKVEPLTRTEKFKKAVKEYGSTVIIFHVGISLISLGTCYSLVTLGLDATEILEILGIQEWFSKSQVGPKAGTFAVAYAIHKVFAPVRMMITMGSVPLIVRHLRKIGFLRK